MPEIQFAPQQAENVRTTVTFRNHVVPDEAQSKIKGRPIFSDIEVCDIQFAGNTKTIGTFPAHEAEPNATRESIANGGSVVTYAMYYNKQYLAFKAGVAQPLSGTPLSELPFLTEGKRLELKALNIYTAEALADLDGTPLKQLGMGGRELKNQAIAYIKAAAGSADVTGAAAENAALRDTVTNQQAEIDELREMIKNGLHDQRKPKRDGGAGNPSPVDFEEWEDPLLKDYIAKQTGERPKGNPSHATLVAAARELAEAAAPAEAA